MFCVKRQAFLFIIKNEVLLFQTLNQASIIINSINWLRSTFNNRFSINTNICFVVQRCVYALMSLLRDHYNYFCNTLLLDKNLVYSIRQIKDCSLLFCFVLFNYFLDWCGMAKDGGVTFDISTQCLKAFIEMFACAAYNSIESHFSLVLK